MNKELVIKNVKELIESDFFKQLYLHFEDSDDISRCEENASYIFNVILLLSQLIEDQETLKMVIDKAIQERISVNNHQWFLMELKMIMGNIDEKVIASRLYSGFAIHFTSLATAHSIKNSGYLSSTNMIFSEDDYKFMLEAMKKEFDAASYEEKISFNILNQGFGFAYGISMGAITTGFYMYHTPESLSFLFGGTVYRRDKVKGFEYLNLATSHLDPEDKQRVLQIAEKTWDKMVGEDKDVCAILIDRDQLTYETVTYWHESPPRVEQQRSYKNNSFMGFGSIENSRYNNNIPLNALSFIRVPSIEKLKEYYQQNSQQIR